MQVVGEAEWWRIRLLLALWLFASPLGFLTCYTPLAEVMTEVRLVSLQLVTKVCNLPSLRSLIDPHTCVWHVRLSVACLLPSPPRACSLCWAPLCPAGP